MRILPSLQYLGGCPSQQEEHRLVQTSRRSLLERQEKLIPRTRTRHAKAAYDEAAKIYEARLKEAVAE